MKWSTIILLIILLPIVMADEGDIETFRPREIFDLSIHVSNKTGDVTGAICAIQIRNESFTVIENSNMTDIGGGWYNFTYNTSKTGKYFCRQNCTQGTLHVANTCDFIIAGSEQMPIAVILTIIFVITVYFFILIKLFTERQFTEHGMIKLLFYMTAFWIILLPLNIAIQYNDFEGGPGVVTDHLELLYEIMVWLNWFITFYFMLWFIVQMLKKVMSAGGSGNLKLSNE